MEKRPEKAEQQKLQERQKNWIHVQKKTFQAWVNHTLGARAMAIADLSTDFADGVVLINLLEILSGKSVGRYALRPNSRFLKIENVNIALKFIDQKLQLKLYSTSAEDIVDGNTKIILGMVWRLIQTFRLRMEGLGEGECEEGMLDDLPDESTTGATVQSSASVRVHNAFKNTLLSWCQRKLEAYPNLRVDNFDASFANGIAFCALIHRLYPHLIDLSSLDKDNAVQNLSLAFTLAEEHFGIPQLLDPSDLVESKPDELSVMTYISEFFHAYMTIERTRKADAQRVTEEGPHPEDRMTSSFENSSSEELSAVSSLVSPKLGLDERMMLESEIAEGLDELEQLKQKLKDQQDECSSQRIKLAKKRKKLSEFKGREREWMEKVESLLRENEELREEARRHRAKRRKERTCEGGSAHPDEQEEVQAGTDAEDEDDGEDQTQGFDDEEKEEGQKRGLLEPARDKRDEVEEVERTPSIEMVKEAATAKRTTGDDDTNDKGVETKEELAHTEKPEDVTEERSDQETEPETEPVEAKAGEGGEEEDQRREEKTENDDEDGTQGETNEMGEEKEDENDQEKEKRLTRELEMLEERRERITSELTQIQSRTAAAHPSPPAETTEAEGFGTGGERDERSEEQKRADAMAAEEEQKRQAQALLMRQLTGGGEVRTLRSRRSAGPSVEARDKPSEAEPSEKSRTEVEGEREKAADAPVANDAVTAQVERKREKEVEAAEDEALVTGSGITQKVFGLRMPAPVIPYDVFKYLSEEIHLAKIFMDHLEHADSCVPWDKESDNQWREDNKRARCESVEINAYEAFAEGQWNGQSVLIVQRQARLWLARRIVAKLRLLKRFDNEEHRVILLQTALRRWLARKRYRELVAMLSQRTETAKELLRSEHRYVDSLRVIIEVFLIPLRKPGSPLNPPQIRSIFSEVEVIMNYTAILLERVEQKLASWSHVQCLGEIFLKLTDFLKVYTQYVYNFPKALTTFNACKQKGPFKSFLLECQSNARCGEVDLITYLNMPVQRIPYYVAIFQALLSYTPDDHPDSANIKLAVEKVKNVVKFIDEKRKRAENIQDVLRVQDSVVGNSVEMENLVQPSRRYLREGPLMAIRGSNERKVGYYFLFNDLLVVTRKQKGKGKEAPLFSTASPPPLPHESYLPCSSSRPWDVAVRTAHTKGKGRHTYKFIAAVQITPRTAVKMCPETVYTTPNSFQLITSTKQYTFACESDKQRRDWYNDFNEAINMMVMQQQTIAEKLAESGSKIATDSRD